MALIRMKRKRSVLVLWIALVLLVVAVVVWHTVIRSEGDGPDQGPVMSPTHNCSTAYITEDLCKQVRIDKVPGSYCDALCSDKVKEMKCIGHGLKMVFLVHFESHSVVLKEFKKLSSADISHHLKYTTKEDSYSYTKATSMLSAHVENALTSVGAHKSATQHLLQKILQTCNSDGDDRLTYSEYVICIQALYTDEYIIDTLLEGSVGIPKLFGACSHFFAMQYAGDSLLSESLRWLPAVTLPSWRERAKLAIQFLDMIKCFETTPFGVLFLCDLQASNFGVDRSRNGDVQVYAIDMDISFFEAAMQRIIIQTETCKTDDDCDFLSCASKCIEGKCTKKLHSSNLQVLCCEILTNKGNTRNGLLKSPPSEFQPKLVFLLEECCYPPKLLYYSQDILVHSPMNLLEKLKTVLQQSL